MLILTTNRVTRLDSAFKSRIHLGIKYQPLSVDTRRELWKTFMAKAQDSDSLDSMDEPLLDELAGLLFNGRMIKNAVRMAYALSLDEKTKLNASHFRRSVDAITLFEDQMNEAEQEAEKGMDDSYEMGERSVPVDAAPRKRRRIEL